VTIETRDRTSEYGTIEVIPRQDFAREFGKEYGSGQHVTSLGPTGKGKTRLTSDLLLTCAKPERQAVVLHGKIKGKDHVVADMSKRLNMRDVSTWPPDRQWGDRKRRGYILVPLDHPRGSVVEENEVLRREFAKAIHSNYASTKKDTITVVDESHQAQETLRLKSDLEGPLMRGAPQNAEWNNVQRGRFVSYHCYDAPEHLFIFHDPDRTNRQRYSEIGGVDPEYIMLITEQLKNYSVKRGETGKATISECLYIRRSGPYLAIVDVK
jgi:hypothetical protein